MNIPGKIEETAAKYADKICLELKAENKKISYSYKQLVSNAKEIASQLHDAGLSPGDRIIIISENHPDVLCAYLGILYAKCTTVLLDPSLPEQDLYKLINRVDGRAVCVTNKTLSTIRNNKQLELPVFNVEEKMQICEEFNTHDAKGFSKTADGNPEIATILFTSGTTGDYKGVMLTHANILLSVEINVKAVSLSPDDSTVTLLPFFHVASMQTILTPLFRGCSNTFLAKLDSEIMLDTFKTVKPTFILAVPRLFEVFYKKIVQEISKKNSVVKNILFILIKFFRYIHYVTGLNIGKHIFPAHKSFGGKVKTFGCGAAAIDTKIHQFLEGAGLPIFQAYGLTETTCTVAINVNCKNRSEGVGYALEHVQIRINRPNEEGEGEICIKSPVVMKGYFRDKEATDKVIRDDWFYTGDLGKLDSKGILKITGRIKELIVLANGKKAMPIDVERHYKNIAGISEIGVVGLPSQENNYEEIHAVIVPDKELITKSLSADILKKNIKEDIYQLGATFPFQLKIQKVHFIDELPKTSTLKVKRKVLANQLLGEDQAAVTHKKGKKLIEIEKELLDILSPILNLKKGDIDIDENLNQYGLDSLMIMEFKSKIESKYALTMELTDMIEHQTVKAIGGYLASRKSNTTRKSNES